MALPGASTMAACRGQACANGQLTAIQTCPRRLRDSALADACSDVSSPERAPRPRAQEEEAAPFRLDFGTHRGKLVCQLSPQYVQWMVSRGIHRHRPKLLAALLAHGLLGPPRAGTPGQPCPCQRREPGSGPAEHRPKGKAAAQGHDQRSAGITAEQAEARPSPAAAAGTKRARDAAESTHGAAHETARTLRMAAAHAAVHALGTATHAPPAPPDHWPHNDTGVASTDTNTSAPDATLLGTGPAYSEEAKRARTQESTATAVLDTATAVLDSSPSAAPANELGTGPADGREANRARTQASTATPTAARGGHKEGSAWREAAAHVSRLRRTTITQYFPRTGLVKSMTGIHSLSPLVHPPPGTFSL